MGGMNRPGPYDRNERFGGMGMGNMGGGGGMGGGGMMGGGGNAGGGGPGGMGGMGNYGRGRGRNVKGNVRALATILVFLPSLPQKKQSP